MLRVQNDLLQAMNNGKISLLVLLDLSAAFDTVDHGVLLTRLKTLFGITGIALEWFRSYLAQRTYFVGIDGATSDRMPLQYGLPQGSVLGPVLLCIACQLEKSSGIMALVIIATLMIPRYICQ